GLMAYPQYSLGADGLPVLEKIGGLLYYLYQGDYLSIFPPLIFMGIGAMTDFGPLIANSKSLLIGAAAQLGVFIAFFLALAV
ncbi:MAG: sodium ion-translocating decarboxylase subunit beta, partial [Clostridiales bacterium]